MKRRFLFQIRYDLKEGILRQYGKYIVVFLFFLFMALRDCLGYRSLTEAMELSEKELSLGDCFLCSFGGMEFYRGQQDFKINFVWIICYLYLAFLIAYYPFRDRNGFGKQVILRSGKITGWWLSKCLWTALSVILFHLVSYLSLIVSALFCGKLNMSLNYEFLTEIRDYPISPEITSGDVTKFLILLPIVSASLYLIELLVSLITKPIYGIMAAALLLGITVFTTVTIIPWQATMFIRTDIADYEGANLITAVSLSTGLSVLTAIGGSVYLRRKDIL